MLIIVGLFSSSILTRVYNHFTDWKIGENDLPFSTNIAIGLQGIGFTNEYINYFSWNNNDTEKLSLYIDQKIKNRLNELQDPNALFPFIYDKFLYSWSDQDFDSMNFIMPFKSEVTLNDFEVDNSIRVGRASPDTHSTTNLGDFLVKNVFLIRNIEKVYLLTLLFLALYNSIKTIKRRNLHSLLLELFVIGTTLAFIIVETQPRYLLYTMVILIVYTGLTMSNRESN